MRNIHRLILSLFVCIVAVLLFTVAYMGHSENTVSCDYATIVIDAGHGGKDGGVVGADGTLESEINLAIAKKLEHILMQKGIHVVMTRRDAHALGNTKKEDMQRRAELINNSDADMVVSIHVNKYSDSTRRGVQVFYDDTARWMREGILMQNVMNEYINKKYSSRSDLISLGGDYFITKCANVPSLIVECGFISNSRDFSLLKSEAYRDDLARYIAMGIESIISM